LDRSLTYRRHLESLRKKLTSRVPLLRRLAGSCWGAGATTLRIATLALVHSIAEYCVPVWYHSAHTHLIDPTTNNVLRIVTGCLRLAPAHNLPILAGIQPAGLRRNGATLFLACHAMEPGHLPHSALTIHKVQTHGTSNQDIHLYPPPNISADHLTTTYMQRTGRITDGMQSVDNTMRLRTFIPVTSTLLPGITLPRIAWAWLNRLRTGLRGFPLQIVQMGYGLL